MSEDPRVAQAAFIANRFKMDPREVLDSDIFDWALRTACASIVAKAENEKHSK